MSESDTIHHIIQPFLRLLNFDSPNHLRTQYPCFHAGSKPELADFAIINDQRPLIIIECKHHKVNDLKTHIPQLRRYFDFHRTVRLGILTNGFEYQFFTDLTDANIMDETPFFVYRLDYPEIGFDILEIIHFDDNFDLEALRIKARRILEGKLVEGYIREMVSSPPDEIIKLILKRLQPKMVATPSNLKTYRDLVINAFNVLLNLSTIVRPVTSHISFPSKGVIEVFLEARGVKATGLYDTKTKKVSVQKDSEFAIDEVPSCSKNYKDFRKNLLDLGTLIINEDCTKLILQADLEYLAASTAGAYVLGRSVNGMTIWKDKTNGKILHELS
jgi:hypothetical protein